MSEIDDWMGALEDRLALVAESSKTGVRAIDAALRSALAMQGLLGVLPLWREGSVHVGLLAKPDGDFRTWPAVLALRGRALTVAASAATLLPSFLLRRFLSNDLESAEGLADELPRVRPAIEALHEVLGGQDVTLAAVLDVIGDPVARARFGYDPDRIGEFEAAHSTLARRIDASSQFRRYADWIDAAIAGDTPTPPPFPDLGPWGRQIWVWARRVDRDGPPEAHRRPFGEIVEAFAGIDTGMPTAVSWQLRPGAASDEAALVSVAATLDPEAVEDEVRRGLVRALREQGVAYDGYAHAQAAAALDEAGHPERAWGALNASAWWTIRSGADTLSPMIEAAQLLCDRNGWDDVRWVVDRNSGDAA